MDGIDVIFILEAFDNFSCSIESEVSNVSNESSLSENVKTGEKVICFGCTPASVDRSKLGTQHWRKQIVIQYKAVIESDTVECPNKR